MERQGVALSPKKQGPNTVCNEFSPFHITPKNKVENWFKKIYSIYTHISYIHTYHFWTLRFHLSKLSTPLEKGTKETSSQKHRSFKGIDASKNMKVSGPTLVELQSWNAHPPILVTELGMRTLCIEVQPSKKKTTNFLMICWASKGLESGEDLHQKNWETSPKSMENSW